MAGPLPTLTTTDTLSSWLTLYHAPGVGAVTFNQLLERRISPNELLQTGAEQLRKLGLKQASIDALRHPNEEAVAHDLEWHSKPGNRIM